MGWHLFSQAIIWTNDGLLSIGPLGTNVSEIWNKIKQFSLNKMNLKTPSAILSLPQFDKVTVPGMGIPFFATGSTSVIGDVIF